MAATLSQIYTAILDFAGLSVNDAGYIQCKFGDKETNIIINGKDLVFPTAEHLRSPKENTVVFHPLAESEIGNESDVLVRFREMMYVRFNIITQALMHDLISILNSPDVHKSLGDQAREILYKKIEVNKGSTTALAALVREEKARFNKLFLNGWARRGGTVRGRTYYRVNIVKFPLYNDLRNDEFLSSLPKSVRKSDPEEFRKLMKFIFPNIDKDDEYHAGSESRIAPFFESFLKSALAVATDIQTVLTAFDGHLDQAAQYSFNDEWVGILDNLESLRGQIALIPNQNPGAITAASAPAAAPAASGPADISQLISALSNQNQVPASAPAPRAPGGRRSITELANSNPAFAARTLMENAKLQSNSNPLLALMGGGNASGTDLLAMLQQQNNQTNQLVQQLGPQGAQKAQLYMRSGMSMTDAAMRVLAETPKVSPQEQALAQLLQGLQGQQTGVQTDALAVQLAAALSGGMNADEGKPGIPGNNIPVGYPAGVITYINGVRSLKFLDTSGNLSTIPIVQ